MSLLLKALEKSEGESAEKPDAAAAGAKPAPSSPPPGAGLKLGGAGAPKTASKLGSALAGAKKETAKKVSEAYEAAPTEQDSAEEEVEVALQRAARKAVIRNIIVGIVIVGIGAGGWFFATQFFPGIGEQQVQEVAREVAQAVATEEQVEEDPEVFLPLAEPIYDIQENILAASAIPIGGGDTNQGDASVAVEVESYVERILQEQIRKAREAEAEADGEDLAAAEDAERELQEELSSVLAQEVNWDEEETLESSGDMATQLERLRSSSYSSGDQFVISKANKVVKDAAEAEEAAAEAATLEGIDSGLANTTTVDDTDDVVALSEENVTIARKATEFDKKMAEGVLLYKSGDLSGAETAFRTILAVEPKNTNALIGLAKVHYARGNIRVSVATLLKASEYSPNNPLIISELIALQNSSSSALVSIDQIYALLSRTTDTTVQSKLLFILGTVAAKHQDWLAARKHFLDAYSLNKTNPDVAYNLAVVNDFLNNPVEAIDLYQQALTNAVTQPSTFDHKVVRNRIAELGGR